MIKITGLERLSKNMDQLAKFTGELDGEVTRVSFDPRDPLSIEAAIQEASDAIDNKAKSYGGNDLVQSIAFKYKETIRDKILDRAAAARIESDKQ